MSEKRQSSVRVSASIRADGKFRAAAMPAVIKFAILLCGCLGSLFTFMTCIDLGVGFWQTALVITLSCAYFSFIFSMKEKYFRAVSIISAAVLTVWCFFARDDICAGIANASNIFRGKLKADYQKFPPIFIVEPELADKHTWTLICFTAIVICAFAAHSAIRCNSASGVCLATCAPVFSVLMFGFEPDYIPFFSLVICWAAMFAIEAGAAEKISDERCGKYSAYCGFYAAVISSVCIIAVIFTSRLFGYERPEKLNVMYSKAVEYIQGGKAKQVIDEIVTIAVRNSYPTGAINHGKLGETDEISFDGKTVLEITIPKSNETIYLRGFIGSVYTGRSWEQLPSEKQKQLDEIVGSFNTDGLSPILLDGYNLKYTNTKMPEYSFSVKNVGASTKYLYMPYNLVPESVSRYKTENEDSFSGSEFYIGQFYDPRDYYGYQNLFRKKWSVPPVLSEDEAIYRQFVYENYLDIPDSFSPETVFDESYYKYITDEKVKTGKSTLDEMTVFSRKLYFIKKWLRDNCEYSLSAGKLPMGKDFVNNFLENRLGSCSHFASAAAVMCRYAGIPARYVEGYIIKPDDFPFRTAAGTSASVEVTDARGHAWVEVYLDGFGWYPVEFTSGYGNIRTAIPTETAASETETEPVTETETETASDTETEVSAAPAEPQPAENSSPQTSYDASAAESIETTVPAADLPPLPAAENSSVSLPDEKPTVGFGVFGIKGSRKVDVWYDLTWLLIIVLTAVAIPLAFILRRNIITAKRRRIARSGAKAGILDDYGRFLRLLKLMNMPEQGDMDYGEYAKALSERSEMLSDGTAELVIGCALKAAFGGDSVTGSDAHELRLAVNSLAKRFCQTLTRFGKFKLKFIYCII